MAKKKVRKFVDGGYMETGITDWSKAPPADPWKNVSGRPGIPNSAVDWSKVTTTGGSAPVASAPNPSVAGAAPKPSIGGAFKSVVSGLSTGSEGASVGNALKSVGRGALQAGRFVGAVPSALIAAAPGIAEGAANYMLSPEDRSRAESAGIYPASGFGEAMARYTPEFMGGASKEDFARLNSQEALPRTSGRRARSVPEPITASPQYSPEDRQAYIDEVTAKSQPVQAIPSAAPSAPYDPVAQLARLREIDPEKYGAAPSTGYFNNPAMNAGQGNNIEIPSDLGTLSPGQLASLVARVGLQKHATAQQAAQALEGTRQQGAQALEGMRERGLTNRAGTLLESQRALASEERAFKAPEQAAQIGALGAASEYHKTQSDVARASASNTFRIASARKIIDDTTGKYDTVQKREARAFLEGEAKRAADEKNREVLYKWQLDNPGVDYRTGKQTESHANGGEVRGYADGGGVSGSGAIGHSQTGQLHPLVSQYGQYLTAAAQTGVAPVPFAQYINLLGSTRGAMQQTPSQFADGGDVSALNRPLEGPGTGRSDSIPAVIDGKEPAALSKGEFVMDEVTTKYYGTKFLKALQDKAKEAMLGGGQKVAEGAA